MKKKRKSNQEYPGELSTEGQRINTTHQLKSNFIESCFNFTKRPVRHGSYVRSHELTQFDITSKVNARPENRNFLSCIRFKPETPNLDLA